MKADLHTHTYFSDGNHSPQFVIARARDNGVAQLALTDHDCLEGYLDVYNKGLPDDIRVVPGVEISTLWSNLEIHVLGLGLNHEHKPLRKLLSEQQQKRMDRIERIEINLQRAGIMGLGDYIRDLPCVSPGRAHVARFLTTQTGMNSPKKAFRALSKKGRFYAHPYWCSLADAIAAITAADGIAVLAHPHRYPVNKKALRQLLTDFRTAGGEAMEVCCSNMPTETLDKLTGLSLEHELWISAGSDFHSSEATWMDIGKLRPIPEIVKKNAIWSHPRWHSNR